MFKYGLVLTLVALASAEVGVVNINEFVDNRLDYANRMLISIYPLKEGQFGPQIYHSDGFLIWDSLVRTGDNVFTFDEENKIFSYDFNIGAKVLLATFTQMEVLGMNLTTAFRAYNNSVHCKYSVALKDDRECAFTLEDLSFVELDEVEYSSTEEFEYEEVTAHFHDVVFPAIKTYLKTEVAYILEKAMSLMCDKPKDFLRNIHATKFWNIFSDEGTRVL